ncbi:endo-1,4-beta-xylanase [Microbacterium sp. NEAU-LLC]|uniref:Beta-xylanase n=1 Tax=Microbacterium helvum TaxID=2773713 RepID=A0ABR8NIE5_9MICO|nr:endo-1,4-beta-xylanase [Microbacterium helvum]MBD3940103.1 endo-1,4-beta-xylanase [Microbacterium helvum]
MGIDPYSHRRTSATITLRRADGAPLADSAVTISQQRHSIGFGCTAPEADEQLAPWLELFDTATLTFYWGRYEPRPGVTRHTEMLRQAQSLAGRGVRLKGHPLVWHTVKAGWVDRLPLDEAEEMLRARIRREVSDFAGVIDSWDVINEAVIMPRFTNEPDGVRNAITRICERHGRTGMVALAVEEARRPGAATTLVINDFDLGPEYEDLIEDVLAAGIEIDAIGLQSHQHQGFRGEERFDEVNDRFARFGLPLHWTETTLVSGDLMPAHIDDLNDYVVDQWPSTPEGEARQAEEIVRQYRALVAHPAVASITYWGFGDARSWLGAPCGLARADGSLKPAYEALRELVRGEWWYAPTTVRTDHAGRVRVDGFAGDYRIADGSAEATVTLGAGVTAAEAHLLR